MLNFIAKIFAFQIKIKNLLYSNRIWYNFSNIKLNLNESKTETVVYNSEESSGLNIVNLLSEWKIFRFYLYSGPLVTFYSFICLYDILLNRYILYVIFLIYIIYIFLLLIFINNKNIVNIFININIFLLLILLIFIFYSIIIMYNNESTIIFEIYNYITISRKWTDNELTLIAIRFNQEICETNNEHDILNIIKNHKTPENIKLYFENLKKTELNIKQNDNSYWNYILNYGESLKNAINNVPIEHKIAFIVFSAIGIYFGIQIYNNYNVTEIIPIINNPIIEPIQSVAAVIKTPDELRSEALRAAMDANRANVEAAYKKESAIHDLQSLHRPQTVPINPEPIVYVTPSNQYIVHPVHPFFEGLQIVDLNDIEQIEPVIDVPLNDPNSCLFIRLTTLNYKYIEFLTIEGKKSVIVWFSNWEWFMK